MRRSQNFGTYVFRLFDFWNFFCLSFVSFSLLFAALIDLLLGLLAVKKTSEKASSRRAIFSMEQPGVVAGNFALSFSLDFLSSLRLHLADHSDLGIIGKIFLLLLKLSIDGANFGQK